MGGVDFKAGCVTARRSGRLACQSSPLPQTASDARLVLGCKWGCVQTGVLRKTCEVGTDDGDEVRAETATLVVEHQAEGSKRKKKSSAPRRQPESVIIGPAGRPKGTGERARPCLGYQVYLEGVGCVWLCAGGWSEGETTAAASPCELWMTAYLAKVSDIRP